MARRLGLAAQPWAGFGRSSSPTARRLVPAVRPSADPAFVSEHPAMMRPRLQSRGSSCRSEDAERCSLNQCQSFDRCCPAWGPNRRPGRTCLRYYRDQPARSQCSKTIAAQPARTSCFVVIVPLLGFHPTSSVFGATWGIYEKQRCEARVPPPKPTFSPHSTYGPRLNRSSLKAHHQESGRAERDCEMV